MQVSILIALQKPSEVLESPLLLSCVVSWSVTEVLFFLQTLNSVLSSEEISWALPGFSLLGPCLKLSK